MPRPNRPRSLAEEANLARRIAHERNHRGWSYEGLAKRMEEAGCPINASALYKVEKADPPRRITVAELVALGQVFGEPIEEMLVPPELLTRRELLSALQEWREARADAGRAERRLSEAEDAVRERLMDAPDAVPDAAEYLREFVDDTWGPDYKHGLEAVEYFLLHLAGVPHGDPSWQAFYERFPPVKGDE